MSLTPPKRVIFNFVARCNMACSFCYVPFDGMKASEETALRTLRRALSWQPEAIVFGGGDPLIYPFTTALLAEANAREPRMFIQLDTNAHLTSPESLLRAACQVSLLGLPVDGITPAVSTVMRGTASHGQRALELIRWVAEAGNAVKVNTVVSRANIDEIDRIGAAVVFSGAKIWSLYQFWPIGEIAVRNAREHSVPSHDFISLVSRQQRAFGKSIVIESSGGISDRTGAYFFLAPTGRAFCTTSMGDAFVELGNILEDEAGALSTWQSHSDANKNSARFLDRRKIAIRSRPKPDIQE